MVKSLLFKLEITPPCPFICVDQFCLSLKVIPRSLAECSYVTVVGPIFTFKGFIFASSLSLLQRFNTTNEVLLAFATSPLDAIKDNTLEASSSIFIINSSKVLADVRVVGVIVLISRILGPTFS